MAQTVLILGATGRLGRHAAQAFAAAGWQVRRFARGDDLNAAALGADVIVNGWNPPYPRWRAELPGLTAQVIAAARVSGATVILPGNVYVYGPGMPALIGPDTPHRATHSLGRARREMEASYREAGIRTVILRGGDFLDTQASGNWFDAVVAKSIAKGRLTYPGQPDIPHAWAFLPDVPRACVPLAEIRESLPVFTDLAFEGFGVTGADLARACSAALGRPVRLRRMNWLPLRLLQPVWPVARGLNEMRYLWDTPHRIDGTAFDRLLPGFAKTPLETAMRRSLEPLAGQVDIHPHEAVA